MFRAEKLRVDENNCVVSVKSRTRYQNHRKVYEHFFGVIPKGAQINHLCNNKFCCNIAHLQLGNASENQIYSYQTTHSRFHVRNLVCKHGHVYTEKNTAYLRGRTERVCITCRNAAMRRHRGYI